MKIWTAKYALTQGLMELEIDSDTGGVLRSGYLYFFREGRDWHRTREEAAKRAEELRVRKIKSVQQQLKKLKGMKF